MDSYTSLHYSLSQLFGKTKVSNNDIDTAASWIIDLMEYPDEWEMTIPAVMLLIVAELRKLRQVHSCKEVQENLASFTDNIFPFDNKDKSDEPQPS